MESSSWARTQLSKLLPLDEDSLQQVLDYTAALPKDAAAEHLKNLLGDSPQSLEFISSYNSRRDDPPSSSIQTPPSSSPVPKAQHRKKGKPPLNKLPPPRQVENQGDVTGAYQKKKEEDYMSGKGYGHKKDSSLSNTLALSDRPEAKQTPKVGTDASLKPPPSAAGPLISDLPNVRAGSRSSSRTASPAPKTTVSVSGGASMHGASSTLQDLDSAIRSLEMQTNPTLSSNMPPSARACSCNATRHPLLAVAPNCLNCGKVICVKEGIGPCTFCGQPLLSSAEVQGMIDSLKQERGQERMQVNNASHRRADVAATPRAFAPASAAPQGPNDTTTNNKAFALAREHRDRLLGYQAENARRTHIIDEAADYETPTAGLSKWSSPLERAAQLKRQQQVLREQEWNARPEYEKRKVVVSVDLVGGKVVKRMAKAERPEDDSAGDGDGNGNGTGGAGSASLPFSSSSSPSTHTASGSLNHRNNGDNSSSSGGGGGGTFSQNPLLGSLIRPVWRSDAMGVLPDTETQADTKKETETSNGNSSSNSNSNSTSDRMAHPRPAAWRRVQDDAADDNEAWILDGGVYGGERYEDGITGGRPLGFEEHAQAW